MITNGSSSLLLLTFSWVLISSSVNAFCPIHTITPTLKESNYQHRRQIRTEPPNTAGYRVLFKNDHRYQTSSSSSSLASSPIVDTISVVNHFFIEFPYAAAGITCGAKASAADLIAQKRTKNLIINNSSNNNNITTTTTTKFELQRNFAFIVYGAIYQGMTQEYVYNHLYPVMFGTATTISVVLSKVLFDLLIQTTLLTLPIAYITKALIYRYSIREAIFKKYWNDIRNNGLLTKYFLLWGPVQCITFSVIPVHLRVGFIALVSFFWLIILSTIASKDD